MSGGGNPNGYPTKDWASEAGAHSLARVIRAYWGKQGRVVETRVVQMAEGIYGVRSDMVSGLPPVARLVRR